MKEVKKHILRYLHYVNHSNPYYILLAEVGEIFYQNRFWSTYGSLEGSITALGFKGIEHNPKHIKQCEELLLHLQGKYKVAINCRIEDYLLSNVQHYLREKKLDMACKKLGHIVSAHPVVLLTRFRTMSKIFIKFLIAL